MFRSLLNICNHSLRESTNNHSDIKWKNKHWISVMLSQNNFTVLSIVTVFFFITSFNGTDDNSYHHQMILLSCQYLVRHWLSSPTSVLTSQPPLSLLLQIEDVWELPAPLWLLSASLPGNHKFPSRLHLRLYLKWGLPKWLYTYTHTQAKKSMFPNKRLYETLVGFGTLVSEPIIRSEFAYKCHSLAESHTLSQKDWQCVWDWLSSQTVVIYLKKCIPACWEII